MTAPSGAVSPTEWPRVVAHLRGATPGPTLVVIGGLHGNEPAGLLAARAVLDRLAGVTRAMSGELVVLSGNREALVRGMRYIDRDLNRGWSGVRLQSLRTAAADTLSSEDREMLALADAIDRVIDAAQGPVHLIDLHTTSAAGVPFALVGGAEELNRFALAFPLPTLVGLLGPLSGILTDHYTSRGCVTLAVEGGQHVDTASIAHHEAVLWIALATAGLLPERAIPDLATHRARLAAALRDLPQTIHIYYRHAIAPEDQFTMAPGFANLHAVRRGELLAHDRRGEIRASEDAVLVMPLYQALGDDGFFLGRAGSA